jgi:hypothetical protein
MPDNTKENQSMKVELALCKIFGDWNKFESKFQSLHKELDSTTQSETKYWNMVNAVIGDIQEAIQETDNHIQLLQASLGNQVDDLEGGPMSIWEAVAKLRTDTAWTGGISGGNFIYLDELRKKLPNWATPLENLTASYINTIPRVNRSLVTIRGRIDVLEGGTPSSGTNPFSGIGIGTGAPSGSMAAMGGLFVVLQGNFELAKTEI